MDEVEDVRREGYRAYLDGKVASDNPYNDVRSDYKLYEAWKQGYTDAQWDD